MFDITYTINGTDKTISVDLPEQFFLRLDIENKKVLFASLTQDEFANDPKNMYSYVTYFTVDNPLYAFYLLAKYTDIEESSLELLTLYDELITHKKFTDTYDRLMNKIIVDVEDVNIAKPASGLDDIISSITNASDFDQTTKDALIGALEALKNTSTPSA